MEDLVGGGGVVVVDAGVPSALLVLAGGSDLLGQVRGGGGRGGGHVRDVGALAAQVTGEEDERDGPAEERREERHGERGRDLHRRRRRHLFSLCSPERGEGRGGVCGRTGTGSAFLPCSGRRDRGRVGWAGPFWPGWAAPHSGPSSLTASSSRNEKKAVAQPASVQIVMETCLKKKKKVMET